MTTNTETAVRDVRNYILAANGFDAVYKHWMGILYSQGMHYVAERLGAYWLIDAIASHYLDKRVARAMADDGFVAWTLESDGVEGAVLRATDGGKSDGTPVILTQQHIPYLDFPSELMPLKMFAIRKGGRITLSLAAEY